MFPSTQNTGSLGSFLVKIGENGVPAKFTVKDLQVWGYKSSNDRPLVSILRFIDFLSQNGEPTDLWRLARTAPRIATADGVRRGYSELFATFPDAYRKDTESLVNFFKAKSNASMHTIRQMVNTFKALCALADFDSSRAGDLPIVNGAQIHSNQTPAGVTISRGADFDKTLTVNLNIEIALPSDPSGEIYEKFFESMKRHLVNAAVPD